MRKGRLIKPSSIAGYQLKASDIVPTFDNVLVRYVPPGTTEGGLHIPDQVEDQTPLAEVISCGPGAPLQDGIFRPVCCSPGDTVMMTGRAVELGNHLYLIRDREIPFVLKRSLN
jgi:co-chaperonin GroES (HSP10)